MIDTETRVSTLEQALEEFIRRRLSEGIKLDFSPIYLYPLIKWRCLL